jgi:hypothetical protein
MREAVCTGRRNRFDARRLRFARDFREFADVSERIMRQNRVRGTIGPMSGDRANVLCGSDGAGRDDGTLIFARR